MENLGSIGVLFVLVGVIGLLFAPTMAATIGFGSVLRAGAILLAAAAVATAIYER
jgi:hypothetical protein